MSFTVSDPKNPTSASPAEKPMSSRDRAVAKFMQGLQQAPAASAPAPQQPVQNPSAVQPEELSAISRPAESSLSSQVQVTPEQSQTPESSISGQTPTSETPNAATSQGNPPALSAQYAQLARQEKALRAQRNELKAKEADIAKREAALAPKPQVFDPNEYISKSKLKEDLLGTLSEQGYSYDQIVQAAMAQPNPQETAFLSEIKKLNAKIEALENETKGTKTTLEEQGKQQYQQAVGQIRKEASKLIYTDPNFETVKATGSIEDVVSLITKTFEEDGELLSVEEAAQMVEDELIDQISKYSSLSKIQKRLAAASKAAQAQAAKPAAGAPAPSQQPQPAKTLSNSMTASKPMTAKERAVLAFEGKLNRS